MLEVPLREDFTLGMWFERPWVSKGKAIIDLPPPLGYEFEYLTGARSPAELKSHVGPAIEPIELLNVRIRAEILSEFMKFCQNSSEIHKFEDLSTFSKLFIEILRNSH